MRAFLFLSPLLLCVAHTSYAQILQSNNRNIALSIGELNKDYTLAKISLGMPASQAQGNADYQSYIQSGSTLRFI